MNKYIKKKCFSRCQPQLFFIIALALLISGCASGPVQNKALDRARLAYETANTTPGIESNAPVALYDAKGALEKAEKTAKKGDIKELEHLSYIAEKKSQLAVLVAEGKASESEISRLSKSKDKILIKARESESDAARALAEQRAREAEQKAIEAELARKRSEEMMQEAEKARLQAEKALAEKQQLEKELAELQAKQTDRGAVITLGNILFQVNKSELLSGGYLAIDKLARFLQKYPSRNLLIEGHTDSRGSDTYNLGLSQQRATSVFNALMERGIDSERMITKGYGELYPVAGNETESGRQQNRRVEVIILDEGVSPEQKFR
ncbi:MAG: OmpA family protein [Desulfamplus sp.]|nr:OmpA family protein [Desulfamplus sp.]